jgi:hypothetical protein
MASIVDTPYIHVYIRKEYLHNLEEGFNEFVEGYIFSVTSIPSRPLLFTVHTVDGAVVSRLPIEAFTTKKDAPRRSSSDLQLWSCLNHDIELIPHRYLKNYCVHAKLSNGEMVKGRYLFTIDCIPREELGGFAETPDEHKTFNIIELDEGNFAALPNNRCLFFDNHFANPKPPPKYKTNTNYWLVEKVDFDVGKDDKMFYEPRKPSKKKIKFT